MKIYPKILFWQEVTRMTASRLLFSCCFLLRRMQQFMVLVTKNSTSFASKAHTDFNQQESISLGQNGSLTLSRRKVVQYHRILEKCDIPSPEVSCV